MVRVADGFLDSLSAFGIDRVCNVRMELHSPVTVLMDPVFLKFCSAVTAEFCPQMVFAAAFTAMVAHFAGGHCNKQTTGSFNDLDVADDEFIVERHRAERLETIILISYKFDPDFADLHFDCLMIKLPSIVVNDSAFAVKLVLQSLLQLPKLIALAGLENIHG